MITFVAGLAELRRDKCRDCRDSFSPSPGSSQAGTTGDVMNFYRRCTGNDEPSIITISADFVTVIEKTNMIRMISADRGSLRRSVLWIFPEVLFAFPGIVTAPGIQTPDKPDGILRTQGFYQGIVSFALDFCYGLTLHYDSSPSTSAGDYRPV